MSDFFNNNKVATVIMVVCVVAAIKLGSQYPEANLYSHVTAAITAEQTSEDTSSAVTGRDFTLLTDSMIYDAEGLLDEYALETIEDYNLEWLAEYSTQTICYIVTDSGISDFEAYANNLFDRGGYDESSLLLVIFYGDGGYYVCPGYRYEYSFSSSEERRLVNILSDSSIYKSSSKLSKAVEDFYDELDDIYDDR